MRIVGASLVACALLSAWSNRSAAQVPTSSSAVERRHSAKQWVALWRAGGDDNDTTFASAREHLAAANNVYVLDAGTLQLHAFHADGARLWSAGSKGSGPGELLRPVDLNFTPAGDIGVLDAGNGRVTVYSKEGKLARTIVSNWASLAGSLCFTKRGTILLQVASTGPSIVEIDDAGNVRHQWPFPWHVDDADNFFLKSMMFRRGPAAAGCALATTFGFGLAFIADDNTISTAPYVGRVEPPVFVRKKLQRGGVGTYLERGETAALQSFASGDTTFVRVGGKNAGELIDLYDRTGRYLATWRSPDEDRVVYANGRMFGLTDGTVTPRLAVFIASTDSARVLSDLRRRYPERYARKAKLKSANTPARRPPPAPRPPPASR